MTYRNHEPIRIDKFNGLWRRGNDDSCPLDHFSDEVNLTYFPDGFRTRDGVTVQDFGNSGFTLMNVVRIYTYIKEGTQSLLALDVLGNIYHSKSPTPLTPILTIATMTDFAFVAVSGRAYISPHNGITGLKDEFIYVYLGNGGTARKAAGAGPTGSAMTIVNGATGGDVKLEAGIHIFGVIYETDTGFQTKIGPDTLTAYTATGAHKADISGIPVSPNSYVIARRIVASKAINPVLYTGNPADYELFFVPDGKISNNTATVLAGVNFYDSELLDSAAKLLDLRSEIPAVVNLTTYHNRMVGVAFYGEGNTDVALDTYANVSSAILSNTGEPEAFNSISGLITAPLDGNSLTNAQEYRDILYLFKKVRTYAYNDNGDDPTSWIGVVLDQGLGASVHGIATVLDSGGIDTDYLVVTNFAGIYLFNGSYLRPELSWKIATYWNSLSQDTYNLIQVVNDPISKQCFFTLQNGRILFGDYSENLTEMGIKWGLWDFDNEATTIAILDVNKLVIGSRQQVTS